jgi:hypothetical protein
VPADDRHAGAPPHSSEVGGNIYSKAAGKWYR